MNSHISYVSREIHTRQCSCTVCTTFDCNCHAARKSIRVSEKYSMWNRRMLCTNCETEFGVWRITDVDDAGGMRECAPITGGVVEWCVSVNCKWHIAVKVGNTMQPGHDLHMQPAAPIYFCEWPVGQRPSAVYYESLGVHTRAYPTHPLAFIWTTLCHLAPTGHEICRGIRQLNL